MSELQKTIAFVVVAVLLTGAALTYTPSRTVTEAVFNDQGQPFFPNFKEPLACTSLEVIDYDPSTATAAPFKVMFKDGTWVIPSHHNYPADAKDRLAKTAAGVIDLKKDTIRSDRVEDQEELGVIDPLDTKTTTLKGRGKRVTLRNKADEILADFIIGSEVPGRTDMRFVRVPDQKRTYGVNVKVDLSTRFADWIETNLLKLEPSHVRKLVFDNHKVIPEEGRVEQGEVIVVDRKDSTGPWTLEKVTLEPDQEVNSDKLLTLSTSLGDLKIVGVRPKPAGLTRDLKATSDGSGLRLNQASLLSLQDRGFYLTKDGRLLSNQGDLRVATDEGIIYTLRFGEVVFASGEELTAGLEDEKAGASRDADKEKKDRSKPEGSTESRYLFVTVDFDESLIPQPPPAPEEAATEMPDDVFQRDPDELAAAEKAKKDKADQEKADYDRKVKAGRDQAKELTDRFAAWYYVIPGDSFRNVMLDRAALVRQKSSQPPSTPGSPLPSGFNPDAGGAGVFPPH
jgi:Domain of unknown function (DUF4340)